MRATALLRLTEPLLQPLTNPALQVAAYKAYICTIIREQQRRTNLYRTMSEPKLKFRTNSRIALDLEDLHRLTFEEAVELLRSKFDEVHKASGGTAEDTRIEAYFDGDNPKLYFHYRRAEKRQQP